MSWVAPAIGLASSAVSAFGGSKKKSKQTTESAPWSGVQPYLLGKEDPGSIQTDANGNPVLDEYGVPVLVPGKVTPGVYPEAADIYGQNKWSDMMSQLTGAQSQYLQDQYPGQRDAALGLGQNIAAGQYYPNYNPVAPVAAPGEISAIRSGAPERVTTPTIGNFQSNLAGSRTAQGVLNPTASLSKLLGGQVDNPQLQAMFQSYINDAGRGYDDMLQGLRQNAMPSIRNEAISNGQYGSSRQGIAEGLMNQEAVRAARDLTLGAQDSGAMLYGTAYENAQGRMSDTANALDSRGVQNSQFNASLGQAAGIQNALNSINSQQFNSAANMGNNQFNVTNAIGAQRQNVENLMNSNQFNANLGLQNNTQGAANSATQLQQQFAALDAAQQGNAIQSGMTSGLLNAQQAPGQYNWANLANYAGITQPGTQIQSQTSSYSPGSWEQAGAIGGGVNDLVAALGQINWGGNSSAGTPAASSGGSNFGTSQFLNSSLWD